MRGRLGSVTLAAAAAIALAVPAGAQAERLNSYKVKLGKATDTVETLARQGFDVTEGGKGRSIEIVATATQARKLREQGVRARLTRAEGGRTALRAHMAAEPGWQVWRPYLRTDVALSGDAGNPKDNLVTQMQKLEQKYPKLADLQQIGTTHQQQPIYAMRVTKNPKQHKDGSRPAVLYTSVQHAREWLAGETNRRQLRLFLDNYGREGTAIGTDGQPVEGVSAEELTKLVNTRELWFVLVVNPDGYDHTFTPENRLWRKNLRDNNGNGVIGDAGDGVDPNRNLNTNWGYDNEGSSDDPSSETYRGPSAGSEPETQAINDLSDRVDFAFNKNDHTWGRLLLYPFGWQVDTHAADEPIFRRIAGVEGDPAIPTFHPKVGADLYTTNGDMNDHLYGRLQDDLDDPRGHAGLRHGLRLHLPGRRGRRAGRVRAPRAVRARHGALRRRPNAADLVAGQPAAGPRGQRVPGLLRLAADHRGQRAPRPGRRGREVQDQRRRDAHARHRGVGRRRALRRQGRLLVPPAARAGHRRRAGDEVTVWFEAKKRNAKTEPFTYDQRSDSGDRVLILANEDYTGNSAFPAYPSKDGPFFVDYYEDALAANGLGSDVYDVDAEGREAPHPLGVLSHYDAVVWETGNDNVTRPAATPGVADPEQHYTQMAVRDFVNEGGRLLYAGVNAGRQYGVAEYPGYGNPASDCDGTVNQNFEEPCKPLSNDFLQYYLGSYVRSDGGGLADDGSAYPLLGLADPFGGWSATLNGPDSAQNNDGTPGLYVETGTHLVTSSILPPEQFPQFTSWEVADWAIPGDKPFDPHTGDWYMYSQDTNQGYKRLTPDDRPDRREHGQPVLLHLVQHRGGLGLRVRRGAHGRPGRLDDAAGRQRPHEPGHG